MIELDQALSELANFRTCDIDGCIVELSKWTNTDVELEVLSCFNQIPHYRRTHDSWYHIIFHMLPKDGDLSDVANWRPIATLPILYKIFAKMLYYHLNCHLPDFIRSTVWLWRQN